MENYISHIIYYLKNDLDDNEKDLISKVMNMYLEYFKDYKLELGYLIGNGEYTFFADDTTISRGMWWW